MNLRVQLSIGAIVLASVAIGASGRPAITPGTATVFLDVPGRSDDTPWVAAAGRFVAVAWGATRDGKTDVFVAVSGDGGSTFGSPVQVNSTPGEARLGGELPPRVTLAAKPGASMPEIAVLWTARSETTAIKVARSLDGGRTFGAAITLQSAGAAGDRGWPALAFDPQARVHAIWLDHRGLAANHGATADHGAHGSAADHGGVTMAQKSGLYYASVTARGSRERELAKGVCYCCKTALAAGPGGALFAAWREVYPGDMRDMAFTVSRDRGRTFAAPVRISEDGWAINGCPDDGPAMAVDARGAVHVVWPTVIGGTAPQGAIFYASTRDGRTFTPRIRVPTFGSLKPSHPQIVVDGAGGIFIAWDENIGGRRVAAVRELQLRAGRPPAFGDAVTLASDGPAVYPVLAASSTALVAVWSTGGDQSKIGVRLLNK